MSWQSLELTEFYIVEDGKYHHYRRFGECKHCGTCCFDIDIRFTVSVNAQIVDLDIDNPPEWLEDYEGYSTFNYQGARWWFKLLSADPEPGKFCEAYDKDTNSCTIWKDEMQFPVICRVWPVSPECLEPFPECGYSFELVETGKTYKEAHHDEENHDV